LVFFVCFFFGKGYASLNEYVGLAILLDCE
jgi:hypothetical protein